MKSSLIEQIQAEPIRAAAGEAWPMEVLLFTQMPVDEAVAMQEAMAGRLARGEAEHHQMLMTEHPPTPATGASEGFAPGELVVYLTVDLSAWGKEIDEVRAAIDKTVLKTLDSFEISDVPVAPHKGTSSYRVRNRSIATVLMRQSDRIVFACLTVHTNTDAETARELGMPDSISMTDLGMDVARQDEVREVLLRNLEAALGSKFILPQREGLHTAKPPWLKAKVPFGRGTERVREIIEGKHLHTVCESARCPNLGECWKQGTATFMINGNVCTRSCSFCAVLTGRPRAIELDEPRRVAEAAAGMGLQYVVVTAVNRDELADGGAAQFVATIHALREAIPGVRIEVLIPDFRGVEAAQDAVFAARPDVLNHNIETVPRLYGRVRPQARYERSLELIARARAADLVTKSGLMLGLGEEAEEIDQTLRDLHAHGCQIVTIGQYLRPSAKHHPLVRYVTPVEFEGWRARGLALGFTTVESGPLVRSSYHANNSYGRHLHGNS